MHFERVACKNCQSIVLVGLYYCDVFELWKDARMLETELLRLEILVERIGKISLVNLIR